MSPSPAFPDDLFTGDMIAVPPAVDHCAGIGIIPFLVTAANADGMSDLAGCGKGTVVIIDKEVFTPAADRTAAFFIKVFRADMIRLVHIFNSQIK